MHVSIRVLAVSVAVALATAVTPTGIWATSPSSATAVFTETYAPQPRVESASKLECIGTTCLLSGPGIAISHDGGATWAPPHYDPNIGGPGVVDCASALVCVGFNAVWFQSNDGGSTWTAPFPHQAFLGQINDVQCTSVTHCVAVGLTLLGSPAVWTTDDGATTWTPRAVTMPSGVTPSQISCASTNFCVLADSGSFAMHSTDGGVTWTKPANLPALFSGPTLACTAPATCLMFTATGLYATANAGTTWTFTVGAPPMIPDQVRCSSAIRCAAVGYVLAPTNRPFTFDPTSPTFVPSSVPAGVSRLQLVSCDESSGSCTATGPSSSAFAERSIFHSSDGGATWTQGAVAAAKEHLNGFGCLDATRCMTFGNVNAVSPAPRLAPVVKISSDAGATWGNSPALPALLNDVRGDCFTASVCLAVGPIDGSSLWGLERTIDFGATWQNATFDALLVSSAVPQCLPGGLCLMIGQANSNGSARILRSTDSGLSWTTTRAFPTSGAKFRCSSATACIAEYTDPSAGVSKIDRSADGGLTWVDSTPVTMPANTVLGVQCTNAGCRVDYFDAANVQSVLFTSDGGVTWSPLPAFWRGSFQPPVCNGSTCVLWDVRSVSVSTDGVSWVPVPTTPPVMIDLKCPSATSCVYTTSLGSNGAFALGTLSLTYQLIPTVSGLVPARLLETRVGPGLETADHLFQGIGLRPAGSVLQLQVAGRGGVPANATSAMLNVTVTEPAAPGFVTVYPCGTALPVASSLNYVRGLTVANSVLAKLGSGGTVCIYTRAATHLVIDADAFVPTGSNSVFGVAPARLLETRKGAGLVTVDHQFQGVGKMAAGATLVLQVSGRGGVPFGAGSAVLNVTVTEPTAPGFITAYPCDTTRPLASSVNYVPGQTVPNGVYAKLDPAGRVCLFTSSPTQLVVDVNAYTPGAGSYLDGLVPARLLETRTGPGLGTVDGLFNGIGALSARVPFALQVGGRGGVPSGVSAVVLNVTVTEPTAPGFVTVYPCDQPVPLASNVNYVAGATVANAVVAKLAPDGTVCVFSSAATHSVIDVNAFTP